MSARVCNGIRAVLAGCLALGTVQAQVYTPKSLLKDQIDSSDVRQLADGIISQAHAATPRDKAEAIWRFFLTDGRFVHPGFWYHIAGWTYEEPKGEVLDTLKLLNSYGFGLCYHIAPLLEAVYDAAGFEDARVWFLTGHTVTEVFYDGGYHYFDSDLMGYNPIGKGHIKELPVASVQDIAYHPEIMLRRLEMGPWDPNTPWYPADVGAGAIPAIADVFTTRGDNWLFPFTRYAQGHTMQFVLRPGERMIQYFGSEEGIFYLPYWLDGQGWHEFPQDEPQYKIWTKDGPRALHDNRDWATGRLEYQPPLCSRTAYFALDNLKLPAPDQKPASLGVPDGGGRGSAVFDVRSPYVLIGAEFSMNLDLGQGAAVSLETSTDNGLTWDDAGMRKGPYKGEWTATPKAIAQTNHGTLNAVAGKYGYLLRLGLSSAAGIRAAVQDFRMLSRFQLNMRILPALKKGKNEFVYTPGAGEERWEFPVRLDNVSKTAVRMRGLKYVPEDEQGLLLPDSGEPGEAIFAVSAPDGSPLSRVDAGGRFLDLRDGLAPDKRSAETRPTQLAPDAAAPRAASVEWASSPDGPYTPLWTYNPNPHWKDGKPVEQLLRWPEVDRGTRGLPPGTAKIYVRYRLQNVAIDDIRLAAVAPRSKSSPLEIIHVWFEDGKEHSHVERVADPTQPRTYSVAAGGKNMKNYALIYSCPASAKP